MALPGSLIDRSVAIRVEDSRNLADALVLGQGTDKDDRFFPIRATDDVIDFVDDAVSELAGSHALKTSSPPDRQLEIRLTRFTANEGNRQAFSRILAEQKLQSAWISGEPSSSAESAPSSSATGAADAGTVEERLKKLDDLLRRGVITEEEHRAARAEILKSL